MRSIVAATLVLLSAPPAGADSLDARLASCLACHGEMGQSATPEVPSLGGQPPFFLTIQLFMFRERLRVVELMNRMTHGFSDEDLRTMAMVISKLPPPARSPVPSVPSAWGGASARRTAPVQFLPWTGLRRRAERPTPRRPARGLPSESPEGVQRQFPARLRRLDGRRSLPDQRRSAPRPRLFPGSLPQREVRSVRSSSNGSSPK